MPSNEALNYIGVGIAALSALFYMFVKSEPNKWSESKIRPEVSIQLEEAEPKNKEKNQESSDARPGFFERQSKLNKRIIGISLALMTGTLFSQFNTPALYTHQQFNK